MGLIQEVYLSLWSCLQNKSEDTEITSVRKIVFLQENFLINSLNTNLV